MSRLRLSLLLFCVLGCHECLADGGIYVFVDDQSRVHLSNVPSDDRYSLLIPRSGQLKRRPAPHDAQARSRRFEGIISDAASRTGIDKALLHAVIAVESAYEPRAVSGRGAAGLMQLMPETARRYGVADVFDPADNVLGGARYLAELLRMFDDDLRLALAAYNAGEAAVLRHGRRIPPYRETAAYVPKVVERYRRNRWAM